MDNTNTIIQWNCRGLKANYNEILILTSLYSPSIICLQETFLKTSDNITFKDFEMFNHIHEDCQKASGGTSILIKSNIPHSSLKLNTNLQAVAITATIRKVLTICSIYIPPNDKINKQQLEDLINQLPRPFMIVGDFNGHSKLWGCVDNNEKGNIIEDFLIENDLCLLNEGKSTYLHPASGSYSAIDLSICNSGILLDFEWDIIEDLHGSDHFPIIIKEIEKSEDDYIPKWNFKKANWDKFKTLCEQKLNIERNENDQLMSFSNTLHQICEECIPKSSKCPKQNRPWYNEDCKEAIKNRKDALRKFNRNPIKENLIRTKVMRAKARRTIKTAKRSSWQKYISKINSRTPMKKVWNMIRKISGKKKSSKLVHINNSDGTKCLNKKDIADALGNAFHKNSSSEHYSKQFQDLKDKEEKEILDFTSCNNEKYNLPFSILELEDSLQKSHDTAAGPDDINYQILKHLPKKCLQTLLDIFNHIWESGNFPQSWREATIIPIPKPGKDHTNPNNYRPIALTSCVCKTLERMINTRLVWYLESNNLITNIQNGFRKNRCTNDHLVRLETFIRDAFIKKEHAVAIFFDLEKEYDTTWKYGIMKDLHKLGS